MADIALFEIGSSTQPADNDYRLALGKAGVPAINIDLDDFKILIEELLGYKIDSVDIGTWDMDATALVTVSYSIPSGYELIGHLTEIFADTDAGSRARYNIGFYNGTIHGGYDYYDHEQSQFALQRISGGFFDGTDFNGAEDRGKITIFLKKT